MAGHWHAGHCGMRSLRLVRQHCLPHVQLFLELADDSIFALDLDPDLVNFFSDQLLWSMNGQVQALLQEKAFHRFR